MRSLRTKFEKFYWFFEHLLIPDLKHAQLIYEETLKEYINRNSIWLDLGCGHQILPPWRNMAEKELLNNCKRIVGIDYEYQSLLENKSINLKVRGDITSLPFKKEAFDIVTSNMVLEHVKYPEKMLKEIYQLLKPNGIFIFHTPNLYGYYTLISRLIPGNLQKKIVYLIDGRKEDDTFTAYYLINTPDAIKKIADMVGFNIKKIKNLASSARFIIFPPLVILELLWIRILMARLFKKFRTNLIVVLEKK